jgi:cold shock CspA family protein
MFNNFTYKNDIKPYTQFRLSTKSIKIMQVSIVNTENVVDDSTKSDSVVSECVVVEEETSTPSVGKYVGQCKWFNDLLGYGFVTVCDGKDKGKDIFVHHSGIMPLNSNYRTLKKGEYLNFNVVDGLNGLQAVDVTGINGGPLMCDFVSVTRTTPLHTQPCTPNNSFNTRPTPRSSSPSTSISNSHQRTSNAQSAPRHPVTHATNPYQAISNALGSQWYVVTKSGRKKNLAKYSKEGRMLMKQAKDNVLGKITQHQ